MAVIAEEFVRPPIERCPRVDAMTNIGVIMSAEVDDEGFYHPFTPQNVKFERVAGRYFGE